MNSQVCVDASILLKLVLHEPDSHLAEALWRSWLATGHRPVAPPLLPFEITAVLRKHVYRGTISQAYGAEALRQALAFNIALIAVPDLHQRAWDLATQLNRPTAYDAHYLALAEALGCEFWTADGRLYQAIQDRLSSVHWLGDFSA